MLYAFLTGLALLNFAQLWIGHRKDVDARNERAELLNHLRGAPMVAHLPEATPVPYIHPDDDERLMELARGRDG